MINPTDLVRGPKNRKEVERGGRKAELGVCRIRKLPKDGKVYRTVGSGSVIRNVLIDCPGYKDKCCLVTTDKVLPDEDFDVKDFVLDFRKLNSTLRGFKLANYANQNAVFRFTSGLVVIPLDPKGFETVKKPSIFTFRPFTIESGSLGKLFCPTVEDLDGKHFTVRKDFALKHLEDQLESNKYVLYDEHSSVSFNTLGGFIGTSNRKPHGAVILSDKECKAVGVLYCPRDQPSRISPIWLSQENLKPSSVGSLEVHVVAEQPEAVEPYLNDQPLHNKEVDVSGMNKEDATTLSKKCPKKSRGISESTPDPEASSENDNVPKVDSPAEQQLVAEACDTDCRTSEQQPVGLDEEKKVSGTNNPVAVIKNSFQDLSDNFQDLSDEQEEEVHATIIRQINVYMKHRKVATHDGVGALLEYIRETHHLALKSVGVGCLVIKVLCPTLESLESLWKDYCSGHLNEVAERYLVTDEIKKKLNLETLRLKTTIEEENYLICKKALMEKSRVAGSTDVANEEIEPDQGADARWIDTGSHFQKNKKQDQSWMVRAEKAKASRGALHKASITGQYETVKMLLDSGEDVDQRDKPNVEEPLVSVETQTLQVTESDTAKGSRESLSENEDEHYSNIPVTGELFVSLRYEMRSNKFELHVHNANNLACADPKKGSSDPYVKTYLLPDKGSKRKTKTKKETLNPNFDEILEYFIGYDELLTRTLSLSVWHKVLGRNEFLGEVKLPMNDFVEAHGNTIQQWVAKWFTLTDKRDVTDGPPSNPSELVLALKYVTSDKVKNKKGRSKGELRLHLLEARNLPGMDADGMSDPYCKCYLLPHKKSKSKYKTPIVKRTLNPTFDHKFSYEEVSLEELKERVLEITIYDFDRASSDEFLGGVRLGLGTSSNEWDDSSEDESQIWQTMLSRSNVWIQVVVPLRSNMVSMKHV